MRVLVIIWLLCLTPLSLFGQRGRMVSKASLVEVLSEANRLYQAEIWSEARIQLDKYMQLVSRDRGEVAQEAALLARRLNLVERLIPHADTLQLIDSISIPMNTLALTLERMLYGKDGRNSVGSFYIEYNADSTIRYSYTTSNRRIRLDSFCSIGLDSALRYDRIGGRMQEMPNPFVGLDVPPSFPFLLSDGIHLIFAQRSQEGLGGYDLYLSRLNTENGTYLRPAHLGMPFNSPANDYLLIYDELHSITLVVSDRGAEQGHIVIRRYRGAPRILGVQAPSES